MLVHSVALASLLSLPVIDIEDLSIIDSRCAPLHSLYKEIMKTDIIQSKIVGLLVIEVCSKEDEDGI